jgi:hypothetical protein
VCKILQRDIDIVWKLCLGIGGAINSGKSTIMSLTRETNSIKYCFRLCKKLVVLSQYLKYHGILLDCKFYFHSHVDYIFYKA